MLVYCGRFFPIYTSRTLLYFLICTGVKVGSLGAGSVSGAPPIFGNFSLILVLTPRILFNIFSFSSNTPTLTIGFNSSYFCLIVVSKLFNLNPISSNFCWTCCVCAVGVGDIKSGNASTSVFICDNLDVTFVYTS